ncbi:MAG: hypothetical protein ACRDRX_23050 [Pseudonocardiaceae bacterium]
MSLFRALREACPDKINCPTLRLGPAGDLFVQGYGVSDPALLAGMNPAPAVTAVCIPAAAATVLLPELMQRTEEIDCVISQIGPNGIFSCGATW